MVWRVHDRSTDARLALKQLKANASAKQVALFEREYHTLAGLRHPQIIEVHDYGTHDGRPFYTMELLDGRDMTDAAPMSWQAACRVMRDTASALALLHARRLLHRDVSASNVWRTSDGRHKLIDFGALAAFGTPGDIVGTPPFLAPEALQGSSLDQCTDLYSLGALGYFLLTGKHAYAAHSLAELPELWELQPPPPSAVVAQLQRSDLPEIPAALDLLIEALLRRDPRARPGSATDLIEQLSSIASLEPERRVPVIEGYLSSKLFVARERERRELRNGLKRASQGEGLCAVIEGEPGIGRSRLLSEVALDARLAGATVLHLEARMFEGAHAVAEALAHRLLDALPRQARAVAKPYAKIIGHLSPELRDRLELGATDLDAMPNAPGEARMRLQSALSDWFLGVSRETLLAVLVDDLDAVDEGSGALLAALARQARNGCVFMVCTLRGGDTELNGAAQALRQTAQSLKLGPLHSGDTLELTRSLFGETPNLARLSERLHRVARGNPDHLMRLAQHLVRQGVVTYNDGSWILPQQIDDEALPATRTETWKARLEQLGEDARTLASVLSIEDGLIPIEACSAVSQLTPARAFAALEELVREGVLVLSLGGYRFTDDAFRQALLATLDPARARAVHRAFGEVLFGAREQSDLIKLKAGLHLLRGGDRARGAKLVADTLSYSALGPSRADPAELAPAAPMLEQALALLREQGGSKYQQTLLVSRLATLGYYTDRKYADRYGDQAVQILEEVLELKLMRRLRGFLGRTLALYVGMIVAGVRLRRARRKDPSVPGLRDCVQLLLSNATVLAGVATVSIDPARAQACAAVIEPLTVLGENHAANVIHQFCVGLASTVQDRLGEARARWGRLLARLRDPKPLDGLPDEQRVLYRAGALYAYAVLESWRDGSEALKIADELEGIGLKLYQMSADQVRMLYHAHQGNLELSERYRERVEMHAIQRGTAWQVETWAPGSLITVYLRTYDARGMRHSVEQLRQLKERVPSLSLYATRSRGAYLLLREKHDQAVEWLSHALDEEPLAVVGWARGHGALARAHNALGQYETAKKVCRAALDRLVDADLSFPAMNLIVQTELAIAEAGMGNHQLATQQIDALLQRYRAAQGPLTLGAIHEAGARVAELAGDATTAQKHTEEMERWYRGTGIPSLIGRCERLTRARRPSGANRSRDGQTAHTTSSIDPSSIAYRLRHGEASTSSTSSTARWALSQLLELETFSEGMLVLKQPAGALEPVCIGSERPPEAVLEWVGQRLAEEAEIETHTTVVGEVVQVAERDRFVLDGRHYCLSFVRTKQTGRSITLGALVMASEQTPKVAFAPDVLRAIADRLAGTQSI